MRRLHTPRYQDTNMVGTSEPLTITLSKPFVIEKIPATEITISSIEIYEIIDSRINKTVTAMLNNRPFQVILWSGEYDNIDNGPMLMFKYE
jgi:hypothetical protein